MSKTFEFRKVNHAGTYNSSRRICSKQSMMDQMDESVSCGAFFYIPCWLGSMRGEICSNNQLKTKLSKIVLSVGVSEIGLRF